MIELREILMHMDRTYIAQQRRRPVYELGLHLFRITDWEHPRIQPQSSDGTAHVYDPGWTVGDGRR
eukprot:scaffold213_cov94-Cylindrotheca_fusiformis.AAC.2